MIETIGLCKHFGSRPVLNDIHIGAKKGELLTILGPNGAGKTTLIRILATLLKPSSGKATIFNLDLQSDANTIRQHLGILSHKTYLYGNLTARENLDFYGKLYKVANLNSRIDTLLERVGLSGRADDLVRNFSRGMQQRLALARAIIHRPAILLLDEPYAGLDQNAGEILSQQLEQLLDDECTILMTTHDFNRALEKNCTIVILNGGKKVFESKSADMSVKILQDIFSKFEKNRKDKSD